MVEFSQKKPESDMGVKNKKILLISHELSISGAPNSLLRQAKYFWAAGYKVDVWTIRGGKLLSKYQEAGFEPLIFKTDTYWKIIKAWRLSTKDYSFILCNTTETYKYVDVLRRTGIPLVWFIRETKLVDDAMTGNPTFASLFSRFENIYTVSDYAADVVRKYNPHVRVINNAVADMFEHFTPIGKKLRFGYIGSIIPVKGVDVLTRAFDRLAKENKNVTLTIAGNYNHTYGCKIFKNTKNAVWLGEIESAEKQKFFDDIDVLVVPSLDEPSGLTAIEGCMYGKIMITTDKVGANYLIDDGKGGLIVKAGDENALYAAMKFLSEKSREILSAMQRATRQQYISLGTPERERAEVLAMADEFCKRPRKMFHKCSWFFYIFEKELPTGGKRIRFYFLGRKILSIHKDSFCGHLLGKLSK